MGVTGPRARRCAGFAHKLVGQRRDASNVQPDSARPKTSSVFGWWTALWVAAVR